MPPALHWSTPVGNGYDRSAGCTCDTLPRPGAEVHAHPYRRERRPRRSDAKRKIASPGGGNFPAPPGRRAILESPLRNIHHRTQKNRSHHWERRSGSLLFVESCDRLGAVLPVTVGGSPVLGGNLLCPRIERRGGDRYGYMDRALCLRYVSHRADLSDRSDH